MVLCFLDGKTNIFSDEVEKRVYASGVSCYIPYSVLQNMEEEDRIAYTFDCSVHSVDDKICEGSTVVLHLDIELAQEKYRYSRFGSFQEVLAKVAKD